MATEKEQNLSQFPEIGWFADQVKIKRGLLGISQTAFAERCGLTQAYLSALERRAANPTLQVMSTIAAQLDVGLWELVVDPEDVPE